MTDKSNSKFSFQENHIFSLPFLVGNFCIFTLCCFPMVSLPVLIKTSFWNIKSLCKTIVFSRELQLQERTWSSAQLPTATSEPAKHEGLDKFLLCKLPSRSSLGISFLTVQSHPASRWFTLPWKYIYCWKWGIVHSQCYNATAFQRNGYYLKSSICFSLSSNPFRNLLSRCSGNSKLNGQLLQNSEACPQVFFLPFSFNTDRRSLSTTYWTFTAKIRFTSIFTGA